MPASEWSRPVGRPSPSAPPGSVSVFLASPTHRDLNSGMFCPDCNCTPLVLPRLSAHLAACRDLDRPADRRTVRGEFAEHTDASGILITDQPLCHRRDVHDRQCGCCFCLRCCLFLHAVRQSRSLSLPTCCCIFACVCTSACTPTVCACGMTVAGMNRVSSCALGEQATQRVG